MTIAIICLSIVNVGLIVLIWRLFVSYANKIQDIAIFYGSDTSVKEALARSFGTKKKPKLVQKLISKKADKIEEEPEEDDEELDYGNVRMT